MLSERRDELIAHFGARFQGERQQEEQALRTFCRPNCPDLTTFNLMSDGGPRGNASTSAAGDCAT